MGKQTKGQTKEIQFVETVWNYYRTHGRTELPWRPPLLIPNKQNVIDPYKVLVSEVMLQQTQASRVMPKYLSFVKNFPNVQALAKASAAEVLLEWQGLGYNRRGLWLRDAAMQIVKKHNTVVPQDKAELIALKSIGTYTAGAVRAFAWNLPEVFLETNIRAVFIHHFFDADTIISDEEIIPLVERTLSQENPREWYYALMDYGSFLKQKKGVKPSRSHHYRKQSVFKGSNRELRAHILKHLLKHPDTEIAALATTVNKPIEEVIENVEKMEKEGLLEQTKNSRWRVAS